MPQPVIVGYGETPFHKERKDQWHPYVYMREAVQGALGDAGVGLRDVDGFAASSSALHRDNVTNIAQFLGVSARWLVGGLHGGANAASGVVRGARAIADGTCDVVVVVAADNDTPQDHMDQMDEFNWGNYSYLRPYGFGGANGIMALVQRRHMHEYGTTREQLSHVAVTQREHALSNPNAIFERPLSREEYLGARAIVEPIHLFDCVHPCGGGGAVVMASREKAETLGGDPVYVLGRDEYHAPAPLADFALARRNRGLSFHTSLEQAGIQPWDVDCVQLYDNYPIWVVIQLEDLGFCRVGEGGAFVEETDLSVRGELPLNTGGGQLSVGQPGAAGGMVMVVEAVRQLRGEGGDRQVPGCEVAVATGEGMMSYGGGLSTASVILGRRPPGGVGG